MAYNNNASTHPMLNSEVLDMLLEACDDQNATTTQELSQFRLVCTNWNTASQRLWRRSFTQLAILPKDIVLGKDTTLASLQQSSDSTRVEVGLNQFLELIRAEKNNRRDVNSLGRKLFCNFHLENWTSDMSLAAREEFWRECGSWMKQLSFFGCKLYDDLDHFRDIIFRHTPNLQKLFLFVPWFRPSASSGGARQYPVQTKLEELDIYTPKSEPNSPYWPLQWSEILASFPNLKTLKLERMPAAEVEKLLRAIISRKRDGAPVSLVELKLPNEYYDQSIVDLFREAALPLESLSIDYPGYVGNAALSQLLGLHATTLQKVSYITPSRDPNGLLGGSLQVYYERLAKLEIAVGMAPDFSFLQYTPALEVLHLIRSDWSGNSSEGTGLFQHVQPVITRPSPRGSGVANEELRMTQLTEFKTPFWIDDREGLLKMTKWMPFVARLSVPLSRATFQVVCTAWKDTLKELDFPEGTQIGDEELTGVPPDANGSQAEESGQEERPPNITDLKELEKFSHSNNRRRANTDWAPMTFSDHAVRHGFLLLPHLASLQLFVKHGFRDTASIIRDLLQEKIRSGLKLDVRK